MVRTAWVAVVVQEGKAVLTVAATLEASEEQEVVREARAVTGAVAAA